MNQNQGYVFSVFTGPAGYGGVVAGPAGLEEIILPFEDWSEAEVAEQLLARYRLLRRDGPLSLAAAAELVSYFAGARPAFVLPLHLDACTSFYQTVYRLVQQIPYGQVRSYGEVAAAVGRPGAARAVGAAMAANRLPIIIPCHRVVASNGQLTGYSAAGGIDSKKFLLCLERVALSPTGRVVREKP